jgi:hypothetical protein
MAEPVPMPRHQSDAPARLRGVVRNRSYFGELDPFGDDNLIFGASKLNLKAVESPIRDAARK